MGELGLGKDHPLLVSITDVEDVSARREVSAEVLDHELQEDVLSTAPGKLKEAEAQVGRSKVRKGLWIAENIKCPDAMREKYKAIVALFTNVDQLAPS